MGKIAFLFSGQGAQSVGMCKDFYDSSEETRRLFDAGENIRPGTKHICFEGDGATLTLTENAQPCLFLTDLSIAKEVKKSGVIPDAVAGFSLGEIPALAFSGVMSEEDAFRLVVLRGEKMGEAAKKHPGGMVAALKLAPEIVEETAAEFTQIWPVNYNCPGQVSCAGNLEQLDGFCAALKAKGGRAVKLAVSGAFHSPYMAEASEALKKALAETEINGARIPLYSDMTGEVYPSDRESIIQTVSAQASSPVRWEKILRNMYSAGFDTFIEVGVGSTLKGFVNKTLPDAKAFAVTDVKSLEALKEALK